MEILDFFTYFLYNILKTRYSIKCPSRIFKDVPGIELKSGGKRYVNKNDNKRTF